MTGPRLVSIIIPAHNAGDTIDCCLEALARQTVPRERYEIIVVDDGSADDTAARIRAHDGVRLLTQDNAGPAAARNRGVEHARGDIVLFTDADCVPRGDWIECLAAPFDDKRIAGVKGAYLTEQRQIVARFVQLEYEDKYDHMAGQEFIDFVDTYAAGYRREVFVAHGGFDTAFPVASVEDHEFSFRLARQGCKMVFVPGARVYHLGHARNLWAYCQRKFIIGYWKVMVARHHPDKLLRDSHTPQVLKIQVLLVGLAGLALLGGLFWSPLVWGSGILALLFLVSTLPFVYKAWRKDRLVALASPGLLFMRSLALGAGFALGLIANLGARLGFGGQRNVADAASTTAHFAPLEAPNDE